MANHIDADFVEHIHDVLVGVFMPFNERVDAAEYRNRALIESAVNRPFHTVGDAEVYPTLAEKAASLFHSLACNHCFFNGNKRTAVIALDFFMMANNHLLLMTSNQVYRMANDTVQANMNGIRPNAVMAGLVEKIAASCVDIVLFKDKETTSKLSEEQQIRLARHLVRSLTFAFRVMRIRAPLNEEQNTQLIKIEEQLDMMAAKIPALPDET